MRLLMARLSAADCMPGSMLESQSAQRQETEGPQHICGDMASEGGQAFQAPVHRHQADEAAQQQVADADIVRRVTNISDPQGFINEALHRIIRRTYRGLSPFG